MKRILLLLDEYSEMAAIETILRKVGFDTMSMSKEVGLEEKMLSFAPDLLFMIGTSKKINGLNITRKFRTQKARMVLLFRENQRPNPKELAGCRIDAILSTPLNPDKFLQLFARLLKEPADKYTSKFEKMATSGDEELESLQGLSLFSWDTIIGEENEPMVVTGKEGKRVEKYIQLVKNLPEPPSTGIDREDAQNKQREMEATWNMTRVRKINDKKQAFAKALFGVDSAKKKKSV